MPLQRGQLQELQSIASDLIQQHHRRIVPTKGQLIITIVLCHHSPYQEKEFLYRLRIYIILFIAVCFSQGLACSTVTTYVSALSFQHKIRNMADPTQNFIVKKCLQGYRNRTGIVDSRLPITPCILKQLIASLQYTASSYFLRVLMKSMY